MTVSEGEQKELARLTVPDQLLGHPTWFRLEDQLKWYDDKSVYNQSRYKLFKIMQIIIGAAVPVISLLPEEWAKLSSIIVGVVITVLEAMQQVSQYSALWISYRATAENLKREKYSFLANSGPYKGLSYEERLVLLADRIEEHISNEHAQWKNDIKSIIQKEKPKEKQE